MLVHFTEDGKEQFCSFNKRKTKPELSEDRTKVNCPKCIKKLKEIVHYDLNEDRGYIICSTKIPKLSIRKTTQKNKVTCPKCKLKFNSPVMFTHFEKNGTPICSNAKNIDLRFVFAKDKEDITCLKCKKKLSTEANGLEFYLNKKHGYCVKINRFTHLRLGENLYDKLDILVVLSKDKISSTSCKFASVPILSQFISIKLINYLRTIFQEMKDRNNRDFLYVQDVYDFLN